MMNINLTAADVIAMMSAKGNTITATDLNGNKEYQEELKKAQDHNTKWAAIETAYKTAGITDPVALEAMTNVAAQGPRIDITALQKKYIDMMQAQEDAKAKAEQVKFLETGVEVLTEMGLITPTETPQVVSTPAPAPSAPAPQAPAESRMTMAERKAYLRDMIGAGTGTNQFRRHCSTTASANEARAVVERWRSLGYISGTQKAELRAEINAAAWLGHCGVTATR